MRFRARVLCLKCEEEYVTRLMKEKKIPVKCKFCGSKKLVENPDYSNIYFEVEE